jgi:hypothetical protein
MFGWKYVTILEVYQPQWSSVRSFYGAAHVQLTPEKDGSG